MFLVAPCARTRSARAVFFLVVVFFVSFRFETGFDWPVYKAIFQAFQNEFKVTELLFYQASYSQEAGFLLLAGIFASFLPNYEIFQALISLVFLISIWRLSLAVGVNNIAMVFALVLSYLLLTVGFSTVRQSLAIAVFNFGLIAMLSSRRWLGASLFALSVTVQLSASIYIAAFIIVRVFLAFNRVPKFGAMIAIVVFSLILWFGVVPTVASFVPFISDRLSFYFDFFGSPTGVGLWEIYFIIAFVCISVHVSFPRRNSPEISSKDVVLRSMIVVLCAVGLASEFFPVIRDRASYEMWILYAVLLAKGGLRFKWSARLVAFSFGTFFTFLNVLSYPGQLAFVPYENVVICHFSHCESSGSDRQNRMFEALNEVLKR